MTPVRLEPAALRSRVKHSTTEPLRSQINPYVYLIEVNNCIVYLYKHTMSMCTSGVELSDTWYYTIPGTLYGPLQSHVDE